MNFFKRLFSRKEENEISIKYVIIEKLKPWIVLNCLKNENYIITDNQAERIAFILIKQAKKLKVFDKVIKNSGLI